MEPKPLLFPFLYDVQEASELSESTSIYEMPVLHERMKQAEKADEEQQVLLSPEKPIRQQMRSIALKNRTLVQGVVLRNEVARLLVETKDGPMWIAKSQIVQIYDA